MSLEQARKIYRRNRDRMNKIRGRARFGDRKAALEVLPAMVRTIDELAEVGYRHTSEDETPANTLVPITKEWADEQRRRQERRKEITTALEDRSYTNVEAFQSLLDELRNL